MDKKNKQPSSDQDKKTRKEHSGKKPADKNARPEVSAKGNKRSSREKENGDFSQGNKDAEMDDNPEEKGLEEGEIKHRKR